MTTEHVRPTTPDARAVFERIAHAAAATIGCGLFTITAFASDTMEVERVFSSDPSAYPVGGRKPKRDTAFGRQVLVAGEPLVSEGDEAIARMFDDHATIRRLGMHASVNVPVIGDDGRVLGVLNVLVQSDRILPAQLAAARDLAREPALIAALGAPLAHRRDGTAN